MTKLIIGITGLTEDPISTQRGSAGAGKDTVADRLVERHQFVKVSLADPMKRLCRDIFGFSDDQMWGPSEKRNEPDKAWPRPRRAGPVCRPCADKVFDAAPQEMPKGPGYFGRRPCIVCGVEKPSSELEHRHLPTEYLTPRHALQTLGTEWGRECSPDIWVRQALIVAKALLEKGDAVYTAKGGLKMSPLLRELVGEPGGVVIPDVRFENEFDAIRQAGGIVIRVKRWVHALPGAAGQHQSERGVTGYADSMFDYLLGNTADIGTLHLFVDRMMDVLRGKISPTPGDRSDNDIPGPPGSKILPSGSAH